MDKTVPKANTAQCPMVLACSGAADVGGVADGAARALSREKTAVMCCTAAVAAGTSVDFMLAV